MVPTDLPIGHHLLEGDDGRWRTRLTPTGRCIVLNDPLVVRKLWADGDIEVDFVPTVPVQTTPAPAPVATPPAAAPSPPTQPHDALMVSTSVSIAMDDNTTREVPAGHIMLRRTADSHWEILMGADVLTVSNEVAQRGLQSGWFRHLSSTSDLEERVVTLNFDALIQRTTARMNESLLGAGSSLSEAIRSMANLSRVIDQPGMFTSTTVTVTQPPPPKTPEAPPKEANPSSAIDQILADDE